MIISQKQIEEFVEAVKKYNKTIENLYLAFIDCAPTALDAVRMLKIFEKLCYKFPLTETEIELFTDISSHAVKRCLKLLIKLGLVKEEEVWDTIQYYPNVSDEFYRRYAEL